MFVIACKYSQKFNFIVPLVEQIRSFHADEEIVVVDSASDDKSYFAEIEKYGAIVEDINNRNFDFAAYWYAFNKYSDRPYYYFMHDSMKVKANLDHLKEKEVTILAYFGRPNAGGFITKRHDIETLTEYKWLDHCLGVYGPIFFAQNQLMQRMKAKGLDKIAANNKIETGGTEAALGLALTQEGFDIPSCALFGDILALELTGGKSGPWPHNTEWQHPVEKMYAWRKGRE